MIILQQRRCRQQTLTLVHPSYPPKWYHTVQFLFVRLIPIIDEAHTREIIVDACNLGGEGQAEEPRTAASVGVDATATTDRNVL